MMIKDLKFTVSVNEEGVGVFKTPKLNGFLHFFTYSIEAGTPILKISSLKDKNIVFFKEQIEGNGLSQIRLHLGETNPSYFKFPVDEQVEIRITNASPKTTIPFNLRYEK